MWPARWSSYPSANRQRHSRANSWVGVSLGSDGAMGLVTTMARIAVGRFVSAPVTMWSLPVEDPAQTLAVEGQGVVGQHFTFQLFSESSFLDALDRPRIHGVVMRIVGGEHDVVGPALLERPGQTRLLDLEGEP